jgi:hypothetical protein
VITGAGRKRKQEHLRVYGYKAFAMTVDAQLKRNRPPAVKPKGLDRLFGRV